MAGDNIYMKYLFLNIARLFIRRIYYSLGYIRASINGVRIDEGAKISPYCKLYKVFYLGSVRISRDVAIGRGTYVNSGTIDSGNIGNFCSIGYDVHIGPTEHALQNWTTSPQLAYVAGFPRQSTTLEKAIPIIKDEVWIGRGVTVLRGIVIGQGAVIAAGSVVTKSVPDYEVWGGVPARFIKKRFADPLVEESARRKLSELLRD